MEGNATLEVHPAITALQQGTLGVGFSGSGFLLFYFFGVLSHLLDAGVVSQRTPMAGSSGGAITALAAGCCGRQPSDLFDDMAATAEACRRERQCYHTLDAAVRRQLSETLPTDVAARCGGTGFVAVTRVAADGPDLPVVLGRDYIDRNDVIEAAAASSFLPFWSSPAPFTAVRGFDAYDGGFTSPLPCPPAAVTNVTYCIRIQAQPYGTPPSGITEQARPQHCCTALIPQAMAQFRALARFGAGNATDGAPAPELDPQPAPLPPYVDIAPGKPGLSPLPFEPAIWSSFQITALPNASVARVIYDLGAADAEAWARDTGLAAAAGAARRMRGPH
ncbi:MAG: hypothetical protein J3K34DRAFT_519202 [Monoraphidium minutum]|nr:MAG: hypothetical protein J3K34DRAFT_519202 [Monoraphidium minutum]